MSRFLWVLVHRYAGLAMAGCLILVGLTGSLLAFLSEINQILSPHLFPAVKPATALGLGELALNAQALLPRAEVTRVYVDSSGAVIVGFEPRNDPATGQPYELGFNQLFLDSGTGRELGRRMVDGLPSGQDNLMPFIYRLHYNLSLKRPGNITLGIVALVWTIDCFVGFYLTLPIRKGDSLSCGKTGSGQIARTDRTFRQRWKPAWLIKWRASACRINFDLHRAGGLWLWFMLLMFAWSSVGFNLHKEVYLPVMRVLFDLPEDYEPEKSEPPPNAAPLGWREAQAIGERLMREQAEIHGFIIIEPIALYRETGKGRYHYQVRSSLDVKEKGGATTVNFDLYSGRLQDIYLPTTQHSGHTVTQWLFALHEAKVFGLPYRIFVCFSGLAIVMLSVTGVIIWLRKRRACRLG